MTKRRLTSLISIDFPNESPEWDRIRKSDRMVAYLDAIGTETVSRCDADLHEAQVARKQPVEDGYDHHVTAHGSRARLFIEPTTARAIAHEAVNHAILKSLPIGDPPEVAADHEIPRELQAGGFKELIDRRRAEREAKADKKELALAKRRKKAKVRSWLAAEHAWKASPDKWID